MELKCLLMWLLFGCIKGNIPEECPELPRIEFVDVTAERYPLETKLYYECDSGYTRRSGNYMGIRCIREQQGTSWGYKDFQCVVEKNLLSTIPTMQLDFTQKPERKTKSPEFDQKDFCGPPKTMPHASLRRKQKYRVGQVLLFSCQSSYEKQSPTSDTSSCKKVNGKIIWTPLKIRCTNDSSYIGEWPPHTDEPGSNHPSFSSSVILPVTAIFFVLVIIPCIFV